MLAVYLWHVAFGVNLGLLYNPMRVRMAEGAAAAATS